MMFNTLALAGLVVGAAAVPNAKAEKVKVAFYGEAF